MPKHRKTYVIHRVIGLKPQVVIELGNTASASMTNAGSAFAGKERTPMMLKSSITTPDANSDVAEKCSDRHLRLVAIHPGEFLRKEFLKPLNLSVNALALALRVPATRISEIVHGRRGLSTDTAFRLSLYFGTTPDFWFNMQTAYEIATAMDELLPRLQNEVQRRVA